MKKELLLILLVFNSIFVSAQISISEFRKLEEKVNKLVTENQSLQTEIVNLKSSLSKLTQTNNSLNSSIANNKRELIQNKQQQEETINQKLDNLEHNVAASIENSKDETQKAIAKVYNILPIGSVVAFARETQYIPSGWVLCDGRTITDVSSIFNGIKVPNLIQYFIRGKGKDEALMAKGGKGEISGHNHSMSHTHSFTTNQNRGGMLTNNITFSYVTTQNNDKVRSEDHTQKVNYYAASGDFDGNHSHWGTTDGSSSYYTGYSSSETNIPEYIALNYIIRIK